MEKIIPLFIHHEGRNSYAKKAIKCAQKYNKNIVFFGDETNRDYSEFWVNTNDYCGEEWIKFKNVFKNMSFYNDGYAIKIFKRFFAIKEYMQRNKLKECVLIDSDVLSFTDYSQISIFNDCDATLFIPLEEEKGSDPMSYGNYYWGASAGTSYFKYKAIEEIIAFMLDMYENHIDILEKKWNWHKENKYGGGVCEMTLLFLWYLKTDLNIINTKLIFGNDKKYIIDNDIRAVNDESNDKCDFVKYKNKRIEKISVINGLPYLTKTEDKERIRAVCLHFGGNTKIYMSAFLHLDNKPLFYVLLNLSYIYLSAYNLLAKIYIKFLKKYLGKYRKSKYGGTD